MTGTVTSTVRVEYCPSASCTACKKCLSRIKPGQLRFRQDEDSNWFHLWCLLERKAKSKNLMCMSSTKLWVSIFQHDPTKCDGYTELLLADQNLFASAFHGIEVHAYRHLKNEPNPNEQIAIGDAVHESRVKEQAVAQVVEQIEEPVTIHRKAGPDSLEARATNTYAPVTFNPAVETTNDPAVVFGNKSPVEAAIGLAVDSSGNVMAGSVTRSSIETPIEPAAKRRRIASSLDDVVIEAQSDTQPVPRATMEVASRSSGMSPSWQANFVTTEHACHTGNQSVSIPNQYFIRYADRRYLCDVCQLADPKDLDVHFNSLCEEGSLIWGSRLGDRFTFRHVQCMKIKYLTKLKKEWKAMGKGVRLDRFVDGLDKLTLQDQLRLYKSIKTTRNMYITSPALVPGVSEIDGNKQSDMTEALSSGDPQLPNIKESFPPSSRRESSVVPNDGFVITASLQSISLRSKGLGLKFDKTYSVINLLGNILWVFTWQVISHEDHTKHEPALWSYDKTTSICREHVLHKAKHVRAASSVPLIRQHISTIFQNESGQHVLVIYGKSQESVNVWLYVVLDSGNWFLQYPDQDVARGRPRGHRLAPPRSWIWEIAPGPGDPPSAREDTSQSGTIHIFDLHNQKWYKGDRVPCDSTNHAAQLSIVKPVKVNQVEGNCLASCGKSQIFLLPSQQGVNTSPIEEILLQDLAGPTRLDMSGGLMAIPCIRGSVPYNVKRAELYVMDQQTLVLIGWKSRLQSGQHESSESLRIWQCKLSTFEVTTATTGTWSEVYHGAESSWDTVLKEVYTCQVTNGRVEIIGQSARIIDGTREAVWLTIHIGRPAS